MKVYAVGKKMFFFFSPTLFVFTWVSVTKDRLAREKHIPYHVEMKT